MFNPAFLARVDSTPSAAITRSASTSTVSPKYSATTPQTLPSLIIRSLNLVLTIISVPAFADSIARCLSNIFLSKMYPFVFSSATLTLLPSGT